MRAKHFNYFLAACGLLLAIALAIATPAGAQEGMGGETVVIEEGQVVEDDLYVGANQFVLRGRINGDLYVAGGTITIEPSGVVEGDLGAAGQSVTIDGQVNGDARIAGAALRLGNSGQVAEDLIGAGYSLETEAGSVVGGNMTFFGSQAILAGDIAGNLRVGANGVELAGATIGGNVEAMVGETSDRMPFPPFTFVPNMPQVPTVNNGLTVRAGTEIGGDLTYESGSEALIPPGAVAGEVSRQVPAVTVEEEQERETEAAATSRNWWWNNLGNLLALLVVGLLLVWLAPRFVQNGAAALQAKPLPSLGWGIVAMIAFFLALLALFAVVAVLAVMLGVITLGDLVGPTIFGGLLAGGGLIYAFYLAVGYISKILVSFLVGRWILSHLKPEWALKPALPLILGVVIFAVLVAIPYLGTLVTWLAILFGLGAIWLLGLERFWRRPRPGAETFEAPPPAPTD